MFDFVFNTPLVVIGNIGVQNFLLLDKLDICFWPVEKMFLEAAFGRSPTKYVLVKIIELSKHIAFIVLRSK